MSVYKPAKSPYWHYDFVWKGRRFHGSTGQTGKTAARQVENAKRRELAEGAGQTPRETLNIAAGRYWQQTGRHTANARTLEYQIASLVKSIGAAKMLDEITQADVAQYVARRRAKLANGSVNRELQALRAVINHARKHARVAVPDIHWRDLRLTEPAEVIRELTAEEEDRLFSALRSDFADFIEFAILTGLRKSAIIGLRWSDVDFSARVLWIDIKGGRRESLPLTSVTTAIIARQPKSGPFVFTYVCRKSRKGKRVRGERYPLTARGWTRFWRRWLAEAGIEGFRFHDLRHTAATRLVRKTGNLKLAQKMLHHKSITTTARYAHVSDDDLRQAMEPDFAAKSRNSPEPPRHLPRTASTTD